MDVFFNSYQNAEFLLKKNSHQNDLLILQCNLVSVIQVWYMFLIIMMFDRFNFRKISPGSDLRAKMIIFFHIGINFFWQYLNLIWVWNWVDKWCVFWKSGKEYRYSGQKSIFWAVFDHTYFTHLLYMIWPT